MSLITLENVSKSYGKGDIATTVLKGIDLDIKAGEFVGVVGASGSGKTTLMNLLGLLDRPDEGVYYLNGQDVSKLSDAQRARVRREQIGFVFQNFNLIPRLNAQANVELPMIYNRVGSRDRNTQSERMLGLVGLKDRMNHRPNELSGGQMQRVAIARALANNPKIILADEPTGNLDSKTGESILKMLQKLNKQGNTIVIITHDPSVAQYVGRSIHIKDGRLQKTRRRK